ncbi:MULTISPECIES: acetate--CoA ligase [Pseudidiomarina]|uniref:Acetyl-coenzyme A synthetase n=2 Tax=Pseudidiomarina TaxID=2800384 RepID=A0A368URF0_9GAMM|nr:MULTISPECIES: acetate--CoA ligase [Pseudidiomarina]PWW12206.1 acetyl-coenzyme A synthetase [Pseudidiomarina maritima]RBP89853.1 acetyl-coenzyme A synthetase [Pseudidiomarina tainanensis]RCW31417.1 acetyl-coenzyme A synthetase [Pseudidiomarina tainanensis]
MQHDLYKVPADAKARALIDNDQYLAMYQQSVDDAEGFWREQGQRISWFSPYSKVKNTSFAPGDVSIKWFEDGTLNACYNCVDRHLAERGDKTAIIWEGDDPSVSNEISYKQLHAEVSRFANGLKKLGVAKGDRVAIYMPMVPEAAYAMLACARIGAVHTVIFGGFSPNAIADRVNDCGVKVIVTADEGRRGGKATPLKANVDEALRNGKCPTVEHVVVAKVTHGEVDWHDDRDVAWDQLVKDVPAECQPEVMNAEDPLFILYTSGSTGKPKGVLHTTGGYMVYASMTHQYVFDYHEDDVYWCAADVGWITGHSYIVYGPLANGATTLIFEGLPTYPGVGRIGEVIDKHGVTILYTAPTAIRALMAKGTAAAETSTRKSLRTMGSVGEPINPEAWEWYYKVIGDSRCPIVDTWWQTETGGIMITPLPGATDLKPGSATRPFFGVKPSLVDADGKVLEGAVEGNLVILDSWPGQARTLWGDHERFEQTYFSAYKNMYFTGDGARRDEDGYFWITGRVDDVLNVSGHRLGTAEIESVLVEHPKISEAAVVGYPHDVKGQGIYVYVSAMAGTEVTDELTKEVRDWVRKELSPIATPDFIHWTADLPKTRSGKIMRRILRKIAANEFENLGDTSTLADPSVVDSLIQNRLNK